MYNNSKTLYTKISEPNPNFIGETLIETLKKNNNYLKNSIDKEWLFDGDTIEFTTLNFFNSNLQDTINELNDSMDKFTREVNDTFNKLNIYNDYGKIKIMDNNYQFSTYMTNLDNVGIFNNGSLHYNLTLPTNLDENKHIIDINNFIKDHSKAIKIIQWMEPFIIAIYGSPDLFASINYYPNRYKFSNSSQRCSISRYIGMGTYDSNNMQSGKILTKPLDEIICNENDYWWFHQFYKNNAYNKLNEIGMDINFNKHYNHGLELRFLDHITDTNKVFESFVFIIYLMDYILESDFINNFNNPITNKLWNQIALKIIINGINTELNIEEIQLYEQIFQIKLNDKTDIFNVYNTIYDSLLFKYNIIDLISINNSYNYYIIPNGIFSSLTLKPYNRKIKL
jgi:hypothetical protein